MKRIIILAALLLAGAALAETKYDVVVHGATPAGITTAITAARSQRSASAERGQAP
jgi:alkyl hydroperoxide reductase subunit AhpF